MKKKIYFHYPNIINDGIKSTFEIYYNYLKKNYNVILITNSNTKLLKNSNRVQILGSRIFLFERINFKQYFLCI